MAWHAPQGLGSLFIVMALIALMVWAYNQSLPTVRVVVDGVPRIVHTNQATVANILRDMGVKVYPEDRVVPPLDTPIEDGDGIRIDHARPVVVEVDGQMIRARSFKNAPADIVAEVGVKLSPYDKLLVDGQPSESSPALATGRLASIAASNRSTGLNVSLDRDLSLPLAPRTITVLRAITMMVRPLDGTPMTIHTTEHSVGDALQAAGITLYLADIVQPDLSTPAVDGQVVVIDRAVPLTIEADGRHVHARTHLKTVADVLADAGISLDGLDYTNPPANTPLTPDMVVRVVRVSETFRIEQEPVPFEFQAVFDADLEIDNRVLKQAGENGVLQKRIRVRYEDGKEVSRQLEDSGIIRSPKTKILAYGTKIVVRTMDTPSGPIEYWRKVRMYATSYSASTAGTPKTASYYGRTALGWQMRFGIVAVDPSVVKLRTQVYVPGYGVGDAGDTGGAIKGKRIDLGYNDDDPAVWTWHNWVDVYLLTPVPANVTYVLPDWPPE